MKKSVGDYKICIEEATAFLNVAKRCNCGCEFLLGGMYPFAVNASFSCELFIKAVMLKKSPNDECSQGHDLKVLFNTLEMNDRTAIESIYKGKCLKPFSELLDESRTAFEDWRYAYEKEVYINIDGIIAFAEALQEFNKTL